MYLYVYWIYLHYCHTKQRRNMFYHEWIFQILIYGNKTHNILRIKGSSVDRKRNCSKNLGCTVTGSSKMRGLLRRNSARTLVEPSILLNLTIWRGSNAAGSRRSLPKRHIGTLYALQVGLNSYINDVSRMKEIYSNDASSLPPKITIPSCDVSCYHILEFAQSIACPKYYLENKCE